MRLRRDGAQKHQWCVAGKKWRDVLQSALVGALRASGGVGAHRCAATKGSRRSSLGSRRFLDFGLEKAEAVVRF